jgi:hypothetical protein
MKRRARNVFQKFGALALSDAVIEHEMEQTFFARLAAKLTVGARGEPVTLSPNEFAALLNKARLKPSVDNSKIAEYSRGLELDGSMTKNAISDTMKKFDCERSTVTSARKKYLKYLKY